ncbi:hypothetical protein RFI_14300, partial [Reticulomyxa filosa]
MCLHILWNILKYPNNIKYRQINNQDLHNNLEFKCHELHINADEIFEEIKKNLQEFGFKKGDDNNWYYQYDDIQLLSLWEHYQMLIFQQLICDIPRRVCMLLNGKWKDYEIVFDYQHRTVMLLNKDDNKPKIKILQVGNPKKSSLEFNVHIQWYNDISNVNDTYTKWACLILNDSWHFRTAYWYSREGLSACFSDFNSFYVIWKDGNITIQKDALNSYSMTLKQGIQQIKEKMQIIEHFINGKDELIFFQCEFKKCKPPISFAMNEYLLHDIYQHLPHYPITQVHWETKGGFIVSYKNSIGVERSIIPKRVVPDDTLSISTEKVAFNPLLYECDFHKLKIISNSLASKLHRDNLMQELFHE